MYYFTLKIYKSHRKKSESVNHSVMFDSLRPHGPPGSSVYEILQDRILEWIVSHFSRTCFPGGFPKILPLTITYLNILLLGNLLLIRSAHLWYFQLLKMSSLYVVWNCTCTLHVFVIFVTFMNKEYFSEIKYVQTCTSNFLINFAIWRYLFFMKWQHNAVFLPEIPCTLPGIWNPWHAIVHGVAKSDTAEMTKQACNILSCSYKTHGILTSKRNTQKILN